MLKSHTEPETHTANGESEMTGSYLIRVWVSIRPLDLLAVVVAVRVLPAPFQLFKSQKVNPFAFT